MNRARARRYLAELGIQVWERRSFPQHPASAASPGVAPVSSQLADGPRTPPVSLATMPEPKATSSAQRLAPTERQADGVEQHTGPLPAGEERADRIAQLDWDDLQREVSGCTACALHTSRTQTVFGVGDRQADWLIVGEAPGADEDRQGEPFVGRAGKLLDAMLFALGLRREQVFIANILKCRPPNNRDPAPEEIRCCWPFLDRQITLLAPRIILAIGRIAAQSLLQTEVPVGKLRGRVHRYQPGNIPLIVSYHPAYLLRSPREKRKSWEDLQLARRTLRETDDVD
jgi:DNA polymerase